MESFSRDTEVRLEGTFVNENGDLADPTEVTLYVLNPAGTLTTYTYGASEVTRASLGLFTRLLVLDASGAWYYRFKATGALTVGGWKLLPVIDDPFD